MRIAREIIETLKMELRFIKYKNIELSVTSLKKEVDLSIKAHVGGFSFNLPFILDTAFSKSSLTILSPIQRSESEFSIVSIEKLGANIKIKEVKFEDVTNYHNIAFENVLTIQDALNHPQNSEKTINIHNTLKKILNPKIYSEKPILQFIELKNIEFIPKRISVKTNMFKCISCSYYVPHDYVEKDKLIAVLGVLRTKYDISKVKFYAYYKDIPFEISLSVKITPSKKLFVQFDNQKLDNRSLRKNVNLRNLVVFRYDDKFLYYPI